MLLSNAMLVSSTVAALDGSLAPAITILRSARHCRRLRIHKQTRNFRIGAWSSYLGPGCQKEGHRRHRIIRHKYIETLNRGPFWDRQFPVYMRHLSLKGFMCNAWHSQGRSYGGGWENVEKPDGLQNATGHRRGGIEDIEQDPVDRLLRDHQTRLDDLIRTRSRLFGFGWGRSDSHLETPSPVPETTNQQSNGSKSSSLPSQSYRSESRFQKSITNSEAEYDIDPITNRKVRRSSSEESPGSSQNPDPESDQVFRGGLAQSHASQQPCSVQEGLKEYDSRVTYGPVYYKEPDGKDPEKPPYSVQEGLEDYDSRVTYGPVYYKEPDGKDPEKPCSVQEGLKDYDSSVSYSPVFFEELDGSEKEGLCSVQEGLKDYDEKVTYEPFMDGELILDMPQISSSAPQKPEKRFANTTNRQPSNSPFHRNPSQINTATLDGFLDGGRDQTEDLDLLRASDVRAASGIFKGARKETEAEKANKRQQLEESFYRSQAIDTSFPEETAAKEKVKKSRKLIEDLRIEHSELMNHAAHARGRVNAKIAEVEAGWPRSSTASQLSGNFVRDFPEEFATRWMEKDPTTSTLTPCSYEETVEKGEQPVNKALSDDSCSSATYSRRPGIDKIQPALDRSLVIDEEKLPKEEKTKESSTTATFAVRDSNTSGTSQSNNGSKKILKQQHRELVREIRNIYEDTYGAIDCNHRQVPEGVTDKKSEALTNQASPTLYKILAYDPTMQAISEAETTSIVSDSASPLTPAEVLLRLSNPAKFFPHFAPLQSQGYEIVSGSGDVLVFRRVRSGAPPKVPENPSSSRRDHLRRNPIDGMQPIAATGNFASPTGFVNHDQLDSDPPFKSNIDVRREEHVFSGKSSWQDEDSSMKRGGRGKRLLIGAAWVGACSYAVGVVAEFFKTGGMDGLGPKGF